MVRKKLKMPRALAIWRSVLLSAVTLFALLPFAGCHDPPTGARPKRARATAESAEDNVARALDYVEHIDDFEERSAYPQAAYQLNRWLDSQRVDLNWQPDEMVSRLPRAVRERGVTELMARRRFDLEDVRFLQECVWMRQLAQWISRQPADPLFATWLDSRKTQLGEHPAEQLGTAYRLFDWTVRNIQLDELLKSPDEATAAPAAGADQSAAGTVAAEPAALRGLPGPGYQQEPMQALLFGHGDAWVRMRLITLLARQQGLDFVTLAFPGRTIPPRPRPWLSALIVADQLYLFDPRLGLPIPAKDGTGVATLAEIMADPALLKNLEIDERHTYRVADEDLAEVVALVDVVGPALSQRMQLIEQQLLGDHRTTLTVPISRLAARLRACQGISDVYLWSIPFEAGWFRLKQEKQVQDQPQFAAQYFLENGMFLNRSPLARGRIAYLRGDLEAKEEETGAKGLLMQARVPESNLKELETNDSLQKQFGLIRYNQSDDQWQAQMSLFRSMLTRSKQHASFWLGMSQLESGRPDAAIEWLQTRPLDAWPDGPWTPLARYNLARVYESQGDFARAQRLLLADRSLQEHGNYLRARILQAKLAEPAKPADGTPTQPDGSTKAVEKTDAEKK